MNLHEVNDLSSDALAQRFDLLTADATEYALFLTDPSGRLVSWNLGAERVFGYATDEIIGQHFSCFFSPDDVIGSRPEHELELARVNGHAESVRWQIRKDGSQFWCKANITALYNEAKQIHAFARVMHDLTETRQMEVETKRADSLDAANRGKEEFMAMLSHELRNPLSPILNSLGILQQMDTSDPIIHQAGAIIERQVNQMVRLVDDLLDISRITKGKLRLKTEPVELRAAMNRAAESARPFLDARRQNLSILLPTEPLWVEGDPGRLEQMAVNLLNNAAKYTEPGGLVRMTVAREGNEAVVRVADNGIGISPEMLPQIFDLFTQVDGVRSRSHGGLGVGLALVRTLVELHGGRVTAMSKGLGTGSEFAIKLPAFATPAEQVTVTTSEPQQLAGLALRVLVVEDNVDSADSMSILLRLYGHEVAVARTGPAALEMAAEFRPNLVLLDIGLPGMDGHEVAWRLRANPDLTGMTLCALTGYTPTEADRSHPQPTGFDHHFVKPLTMDTLNGLLSSLKKAR
jgi:PAS domain S-box-containing protein